MKPLRGLRGGLRERLVPGAFALTDAPIWADASTQEQCDALEDALGGPEEVAKRTGSRAYARFTANPIDPVAYREKEAGARTAEVSLVSAFGPSVLCGHITPVDASDSTGTNVGCCMIGSGARDARRLMGRCRASAALKNFADGSARLPVPRGRRWAGSRRGSAGGLD